MSDFSVAVIKRPEALLLNEGLDDDNKVAFEDETGNNFYTYIDVAEERLSEDVFVRDTISQSVVDGTAPVRKNRIIFPR